jgi:hypothetical protein
MAGCWRKHSANRILDSGASESGVSKCKTTTKVAERWLTRLERVDETALPCCSLCAGREIVNLNLACPPERLLPKLFGHDVASMATVAEHHSAVKSLLKNRNALTTGPPMEARSRFVSPLGVSSGSAPANGAAPRARPKPYHLSSLAAGQHHHHNHQPRSPLSNLRLQIWA